MKTQVGRVVELLNRMRSFIFSQDHLFKNKMGGGLWSDVDKNIRIKLGRGHFENT